MTLTERIIDFAWAAPPPPQHVRHAVRRHMLDGIGNALASNRLRAVDPVVDVARGLGGPLRAHILSGGDPVGASAAALANGALVHGLDFDDTHAGALVHPTAVLLPAALAVGEEVDADADEVVDLLTAAYEVVLRIGAAIPHGFHARGFHATSVVGVFGAALVAARLLDLSPTQAVSALGIAGSQAAGSLEFLVEGVATKQLHPGLAAMNGVLAARLAAAGVDGPRTILEGEAGLFSTHAAATVDPGTVLEGLGKSWETTEITIKPYPVCQLSHAALDALNETRDRLGSDRIQQIERIEVELPEESMPIVATPSDRKTRPTSTYDARFSLQFCLSVLLHQGSLTVDDLGPDQLGDPTLVALAERVEVRPFAADGPAAAAPGRVRAILHDGTTVTGEVATSRGGPGRPLTDEQLLEKFRDNVGHRDDAVDDLADALLASDESRSVRTLARKTAMLAESGTSTRTTRGA